MIGGPVAAILTVLWYRTLSYQLEIYPEWVLAFALNGDVVSRVQQPEVLHQKGQEAQSSANLSQFSNVR